MLDIPIEDNTCPLARSQQNRFSTIIFSINQALWLESGASTSERMRVRQQHIYRDGEIISVLVKVAAWSVSVDSRLLRSEFELPLLQPQALPKQTLCDLRQMLFEERKDSILKNAC